jgi:hypothetical protein
MVTGGALTALLSFFAQLDGLGNAQAPELQDENGSKPFYASMRTISLITWRRSKPTVKEALPRMGSEASIFHQI